MHPPIRERVDAEVANKRELEEVRSMRERHPDAKRVGRLAARLRACSTRRVRVRSRENAAGQACGNLRARTARPFRFEGAGKDAPDRNVREFTEETGRNAVMLAGGVGSVGAPR